jgi:hypothetical protein
MYDRNTWGGPSDPFILIRFDKVETEGDPVASLLMFEWRDQEHVLVAPTPDAPKVGKSRNVFVRKSSCGRGSGC